MPGISLHAREFGGQGGPPLVILHGLLGSSRNWTAPARELAESRRVVGLDLRNHGDSPAGAVAALTELVEDVRVTLDALGLERVQLLGHSLGGKVAMRLAVEAPARVERLVVVDIAPREYTSASAEVQAMRGMSLEGLRSRKEADERLAAAVPDRATRQFLLTNLVRAEEGFAWRIDLDALAASMGPLRGAPLAADARYEGPVMWAVGGASRYIAEGDEALMARHFGALETAVFGGVGHNVHVEARDALVERLERFLG